MNFDRERNCFYHLRDNLSDQAKAEYELGVGNLIQRYNTAIYENRFIAGGVVEIFTLALMRSVGIEIEAHGARGVGGDLKLHSGEMFSVKGCFTKTSNVILVNTRDDSYTPWTTATLFVVSNYGIIYGDPTMVEDNDLVRVQDNLQIKRRAFVGFASDPSNLIPMRIPLKPPADKEGTNRKASDDVAIQLMKELDMSTLSDLVLSDLTEKSMSNDSTAQLSLNLDENE